MNYKVIIDAYRGGNDIGYTGNNIKEKDFNLEISKYLSDRLNQLGITNTLVRDNDITLTDTSRINKIKSIYGDGKDVIVISNRLNKQGTEGIEINYALRNNNKLANLLETEFKNVGLTVKTPYQLRDEKDTSKDKDLIIRDTKDNQTIIIYYGNVDNVEEATTLKNDQKLYAEAVIRALAKYLNVNYIPEAGEIYVVQKGDSLYKIATKYNTTIENLKKVNNLTTNSLSIGQILKIPTTEQQENIYVVQKGDSLYKIATKYNTTVENLKKTNNLTTNTLSIGQILKIPTTTESTENVYIVQPGDSLYKIATKYNTTIENLKKTNNLTTNTLSIGQILKIPTTSKTIYIVKKGDSLYKIASQYNTTVANLKRLNNLVTDTLSIGQELVIN